MYMISFWWFHLFFIFYVEARVHAFHVKGIPDDRRKKVATPFSRYGTLAHLNIHFFSFVIRLYLWQKIWYDETLIIGLNREGEKGRIEEKKETKHNLAYGLELMFWVCNLQLFCHVQYCPCLVERSNRDTWVNIRLKRFELHCYH